MRQNKGKYILVTGCMFAGKTTRLIELSNVYAQSESSVRILTSLFSVRVSDVSGSEFF